MREERLVALVSKKLQAVETSFVRDQVDRVAKVVIAAKDFIASAVSAEPHAALAWAGVCVLLPVSLLGI
jgi:hypothetical protein